ncbi:NepR family anti-sigma factor [Sphingomonas oleivorans]|nr:NepR family anti-sigma factor [Sphingomonas oleivorans]
MDAARPAGGHAVPRMLDSHIGNALKSAYQQTVNEQVPPEFLDLLGKLG